MSAPDWPDSFDFFYRHCSPLFCRRMRGNRRAADVCGTQCSDHTRAGHAWPGCCPNALWVAEETAVPEGSWIGGDHIHDTLVPGAFFQHPCFLLFFVAVCFLTSQASTDTMWLSSQGSQRPWVLEPYAFPNVHDNMQTETESITIKIEPRTGTSNMPQYVWHRKRFSMISYDVDIYYDIHIKWMSAWRVAGIAYLHIDNAEHETCCQRSSLKTFFRDLKIAICGLFVWTMYEHNIEIYWTYLSAQVAHLVAAVEGAQALRLVLVAPITGSETGSTRHWWCKCERQPVGCLAVEFRVCFILFSMFFPSILSVHMSGRALFSNCVSSKRRLRQ